MISQLDYIERNILKKILLKKFINFLYFCGLRGSVLRVFLPRLWVQLRWQFYFLDDLTDRNWPDVDRQDILNFLSTQLVDRIEDIVNEG